MKHIEIINQHGHSYCDVCGLGTEHPDFDSGECPGDPRDAEFTTLRQQLLHMNGVYAETANDYHNVARDNATLRQQLTALARECEAARKKGDSVEHSTSYGSCRSNCSACKDEREYWEARAATDALIPSLTTIAGGSNG